MPDLPAAGDHQLVTAARRVADEILGPAAEVVDRLPLLPRAHLDALARAGLMGLVGPVGHGGAALPEGTVLRIQRIVAAACGATFFTWAQHHRPVQWIAAAPDCPARRRWLDPLCRGSARAGVAFAYLRRPGPPAVRAIPASAGWVFDGVAPFVTGWGLVDVIVVVGVAPDGTKILAAIEADDPRLEATPLKLVVLGATGTVSLGLHGVRIGPSRLIDVWSDARWQQADGDAVSRPSGGPFGVADAAIRGLAASEPDVAGALSARLDACSADVDALVARGSRSDVDGWRAELLAGRDRSIELANRAAQAWVVAQGGPALALAHPAQRVLREAAFYLVQAQTAQLRRRQLDRLGPGSP